MRILVCSDGTEAADNAIRIGALLAVPMNAEITLLGIAEKTRDEPVLRDALEKQARPLREQHLKPEIIFRIGEPVRQILNQTSKAHYDLVVIGSRQRDATGPYWRSERTYEVIKAIQPPVLVAIGERDRLKHFLVCTGGKEFVDEAVQLTGKLAAAAGASVTLLHVMAEPPVMYADLVRLEEDVDRLLESRSELGVNLGRQKKHLERIGVPTEVRLRHGIVLDQVFAEVRRGDYDLIVTGSSQARGLLQHYIMGDVTRSILNLATCPVLVTRAGKVEEGRSLWRSLAPLFGRGQK